MTVQDRKACMRASYFDESQNDYHQILISDFPSFLPARKLPKQQTEPKPAASQVKLNDPAKSPKAAGCQSSSC